MITAPARLSPPGRKGILNEQLKGAGGHWAGTGFGAGPLVEADGWGGVFPEAGDTGTTI